MYTGTAELTDGTTAETKGTLIECVEWAERLIMENGTGIKISIREVNGG